MSNGYLMFKRTIQILLKKLEGLKDLGYSAEEAAARADLRQHEQTLGVRQLGANFEAVKRMYDIWDGLIQ